jgi:hypothetical protein
VFWGIVKSLFNEQLGVSRGMSRPGARRYRKVVQFREVASVFADGASKAAAVKPQADGVLGGAAIRCVASSFKLFH